MTIQLQIVTKIVILVTIFVTIEKVTKGNKVTECLNRMRKSISQSKIVSNIIVFMTSLKLNSLGSNNGLYLPSVVSFIPCPKSNIICMLFCFILFIYKNNIFLFFFIKFIELRLNTLLPLLLLPLLLQYISRIYKTAKNVYFLYYIYNIIFF